MPDRSAKRRYEPHHGIPNGLRNDPRLLELEDDARARILGYVSILHAMANESSLCETLPIKVARREVPESVLRELESFGIVRINTTDAVLCHYDGSNLTRDEREDARARDRQRKARRARSDESDDDEPSWTIVPESRNLDRVRESVPSSNGTERSYVGRETSPEDRAGTPPFVKRFDELVRELRSRRSSGSNDRSFKIACPVHSGDGDSVQVTIDPERIRAYCHNPKCHAKGTAIAQALGFKGGDLFARVLDRPRRGSKWQSFEIRDRTGKLVAIQKRLDPADPDSKSDKRFAWHRPNGRVGLGGIRQCRLPFFGSEQLGTCTNSDANVVIVEGARKAKILSDFLPTGYVALGTVTGGATPHSVEVCRSVAHCLRVIVWPDNDDAGGSNASKLARNLERAGVATLRFVGPTGTEPGDDCVDFIEADRSTAAARIEHLLENSRSRMKG